MRANETVYSGHSIVFRDICGGDTNVFEETKTAWAGYGFVPCQKYECQHITNGGESGFFCALSSKTVFKGAKNACEPSNMCSFLKE
jgi:hypothetical protein